MSIPDLQFIGTFHRTQITTSFRLFPITLSATSLESKKQTPELALPQYQELTESKAVLLCELSGLLLCLLDLYEHISSEQARAMNLATDSLQGKTDIRMYLTEDRLKNLSFGSILKM